MDASHKGELRDLNDRDFQRLEAKLVQVEAKLEQRYAQLESKFEQRFAQLDAKIDKTAAELMEVLERRLGEYTRWSYLTWAVQAAMIIGLYFK